MQESLHSIPRRASRACRPVLLLLLGLMVVAGTSCRRQKQPERVSIDKLEVVVDPQLNSNRLSGIDSMVYRAFADSPIHWQRFEPETFKLADRAKRLVFCIIARPQHPGFFELMRQLEESPQAVELINNSYVPVLIDADVAREFELLSAILCSEVDRSISFPMFLWLNKEAHPVACTPVSQAMAGDAVQIFNHSHAMIAPTWEDDLERWMASGEEGYVMKNSRHDHAKRRDRARKSLETRRFSEEPVPDLAKAVRRVTSQYDEFAKDFSGSGDMVPTATLRLLAVAALEEKLDETLRQRCVKVLEAMVGNLLTTPMIDPLDGGVFSLRSAGSWQLPSFTRDCVSQSEAAAALLWVDQATSLPGARDAALRTIRHIEATCATEQGLFALRPELDTEAGKWMWTTSEVSEVLGEEDAAWWIEMMGMADLGNLPMEVDPHRKLFRKNALRQVKTPAEMARSLSLDPQAFQQRLEAARAKLAKARSARLRVGKPLDSPHLVSSCTMVSLYAQAFRVTGDAQWKTKAVELHQRCREHFMPDGVLLPYGKSHAPGYAAARAYHHAVALTAAADLAAIAPDALDLPALSSLHLGVLAERHLVDGLLLECAPQDQILDMPIEDSEMAFGYSTLGLLSVLHARDGGFGVTPPESLQPLLERLPEKAVSNPIIYTDLIEAGLRRLY